MKFMSVYYVSFIFLFFLSSLLFMIGLILVLNNFIIFMEWEIVEINSSCIIMVFLFDWMSLIFMSFVFFISSLVILYSEDYMKMDLNPMRFMFLVLLFIMSMMFMIISPNMISILLGWDGLGLVSYCLVIYYQNVKSYNAGMLTALSNRVGDVALLMVVAWMINFGSWNYIFYLECMKYSIEMNIIIVLVMLASMTSSAQIPFSAWLPAAMAAPTPVSALVHSSTLVTAGVYLLIRFNMGFNVWLVNFLFLFSGLTMFMSGIGANFEYDLKKIIALSTLSQLGLMIGVLSLGLSELAFFHLITHALFKALLFMCAGVYIHSLKDFQDIRFMGSLSFQIPLTCSCLMISNFALCGIPFLAGFYSSDLILEMVSACYLNIFGFFLLFFSTGLTVCYSFRLIYYVVCGNYMFNSFYNMEESKNMLFSMFMLLMMVITGGSVMMWLIFPTPPVICLPLHLSYSVIIVSVMGFFFGFELIKTNLGKMFYSLIMINMSGFFGSMWNLPYFSSYGMSLNPLMMGYYLVSSFEMGWNEYFGGQGMYSLLFMMSDFNQWLQFNNLKVYLMIMMLWIIMLMLMVFI
uniref:NADH dehydrogenase subunit 5 n=1 Tax=Pseudoglomeris angustifolia TaxID=3036341 RepID=UPI00279D19BF|nr:NADH dehydrogenase subunit 5 [Pseudoglomeris angustifolia]WGO57555.1 NADH dehydrogenase subunit 5 [Pseudoglomeris angustifolia]